MTQKRAALRYLVALHLGKTRLDRRLQRTDPVWVSCPFPDITNEIVKAPRIWFERINGCRCRKAINTGVHLGKPALPDIAGRDICVIRLCRTPRKANIPLTGPRGVFPFGLGRETTAGPLAVIVLVCGFIPLVGHFIGMTIVTLVSLTASLSIAAIALASYIIYVQIENYVITPRIMKRSLSIPGLVTIIAALLGTSLLGLVGGLLAVPIAAAVLLILDEVVFPRADQS